MEFSITFFHSFITYVRLKVVVKELFILIRFIVKVVNPTETRIWDPSQLINTFILVLRVNVLPLEPNVMGGHGDVKKV